MSDLIRRADALKEIEANIKANEKCASDEWLAGQYYAMAAINRLSSVEPRRGRWIKDDEGCVVCSLCGNSAEINYISGEFMESNYCSECGADMREKRKSE